MQDLQILKALAAAGNNKEAIEAIREILANKQDLLVSGQNIATINGHSLLEGGDIIIEGGGGGGEGIKIVQSLGNDPNAVMSQKAVTYIFLTYKEE